MVIAAEVAELFPVSLSLLAVTVAVFEILAPHAGAPTPVFTLNTKSAVAPAVVMSVGNVHVTTPPDSSQKEVESASSNVRPVGTLSVTITFIASAGPELFTCNK